MFQLSGFYFMKVPTRIFSLSGTIGVPIRLRRWYHRGSCKGKSPMRDTLLQGVYNVSNWGLRALIGF